MRDEVEFWQQINIKVFYKFILSLWVCVARYAQSTQINKFTLSLQHLKENMNEEVDFWSAGFFKLILSF